MSARWFGVDVPRQHAHYRSRHHHRRSLYQACRTEGAIINDHLEWRPQRPLIIIIYVVVKGIVSDNGLAL